MVVEKVLEYKEINMKHYEYCDVLTNTMTVLRQEVEVLRSKIEEHDTGHIHTAISVIQHRIAELQKQLNKEQKQGNA